MDDENGLWKRVEDPYARFAAFYDAYVGDYAEDIPFYLALASNCSGKILEVGCGTGRVLLPLLRAGHEVTGVDISEEMLALASQKIARMGSAPKIITKNHNFLDGPLPQEYGLGLVTFYTFNYLLSQEDQQRFLKHIAASLLSGATLALHLFFPSPLLHPETAGRWVFKGRFLIRGETVLLHDRRCMIEEKIEERIQAFEYASGRKEEIRTLRRWVTPAEIHELLITSGFCLPRRIERGALNDPRPLAPLDPIRSDLMITAQKTG